MERKLRPFDVLQALQGLSVTCLRVADLPKDACYDRFGFKRNSAQDNFLKSGGTGLVVIVHGVHDDPLTAFVTPDSSMVSCAFGEITSQRSSTSARVWYVGVNKDNHINDSHRGTCWGHYGLTPIKTAKGTWWRLGKRNVTAAMHQHAQIAHGSANPFAVLALFKFCTYVQANTIEQHSELPCAQLFHKMYNHAAHPAICLVYQSLGFAKTPMGNYAWYEHYCEPIQTHHDTFVRRMLQGQDASS